MNPRMISITPITASGAPAKMGMTDKVMPLAKTVVSVVDEEVATVSKDHINPKTVMARQRPASKSMVMPVHIIQAVGRVFVSADAVVPSWYGFEFMVTSIVPCSVLAIGSDEKPNHSDFPV
ncbi:MAG: hypothetical protein ACPGLY_16085 [Rubripirellula sp.]